MRRTVCTACVGGLGLGLVILGVLSAIFFDPLINSFIQKELVIKEGTDVFKNWKKPPVTPYLRMYYFNLTNKEEYLAGSKPILQEAGPYTYRQHWEKVNISFHDNNTVTYATQKFYYFDREKSIGPEEDEIVTLNVPMISSIAQWQFAARLAKLALSSMLEVLKEQPIVTKTVGELMWGYDDPLLTIAKDILPPEKQMPFDKFGFFVDKNGSTDGLLNVFTGASDMSKYTTVDTFNHMKELDYWKTDACNQINGTDGSSFPPDISKDTTLFMFNADLCRSVPLTFWREAEHYGIKTMRFSPPPDVFADVKDKPENDCYCIGGPPCLGGGLFNASACKFGSPTTISWPHFYQADEKYLNGVIGLKPDAEKHAFYIDLSPRTGQPMRAEARIQINIAVPHVPEVKPAAMLRKIIFPIIWFENAVTEMPDDIVDLLRMAEQTPAVAKMSALLAFFVIGGVMVIGAIITDFATRKNWPVPVINTNYAPRDDEKHEDKVYPINSSTNTSKSDLGHDNPLPVTDESPDIIANNRT